MWLKQSPPDPQASPSQAAVTESVRPTHAWGHGGSVLRRKLSRFQGRFWTRGWSAAEQGRGVDPEGQ